MTVIGIDDTDSREQGMCTTYVASRIAARIEADGGKVSRVLLVRLNPAVEYKTRGNAALAIHSDVGVDTAHRIVRDVLSMAETDDPRTDPGAVVADCDPLDVPTSVADFAPQAIQEVLDPDRGDERIDAAGFDRVAGATGRGLVGALAAVGAWAAFEEWTYECISYRVAERWGTDRTVDDESVFAAADEHYPQVWDTVDREEGYAVCVPRTPCPILHGIRGDDPDAVVKAADAIEGEPVASRRVFVTNQGTDAHLRPATPATATDGGAYRVTGEVVTSPKTREGGHVFLTIEGTDGRLECAAFEPTKRFRDHVRSLRVGDRITVCGEVTSDTLKLEKFAVRDLVRTESDTPNCPSCGASMGSVGRNQGYRCRDCGTERDGRVERPIERDLDPGWYEVPPCARRHVAKPLVRGGFDAPVHPER